MAPFGTTPKNKKKTLISSFQKLDFEDLFSGTVIMAPFGAPTKNPKKPIISPFQNLDF